MRHRIPPRYILPCLLLAALLPACSGQSGPGAPTDGGADDGGVDVSSQGPQTHWRPTSVTRREPREQGDRFVRERLEYDAAGHLAYVHQELLVADAWSPMDVRRLTWDVQGRLTRWHQGGWPAPKTANTATVWTLGYEFAFDGDGRMSHSTKHHMAGWTDPCTPGATGCEQSAAFILLCKRERDGQGRVTRIDCSRQDKGPAKSIARRDLTYDDQGLLKRIVQTLIWSNGHTDDEHDTTCSYDDHKRLTSCTRTSVVGYDLDRGSNTRTPMTAKTLTTWTYDAEGRVLTQTVEGPDAPKGSEQVAFTYDTQGRLVSKLASTWKDGAWALMYEDTVTHEQVEGPRRTWRWHAEELRFEPMLLELYGELRPANL